MSANARLEEGIRHAEHFRFEQARAALEEAVASGAGPDAVGLLAAVRGELGDTEGARRDLELAVARDPGNPSLALSEATLLPMVYRDGADLERWRERYRSRLQAFVDDAERFAPQASKVLGWARTNFLLAYQGRDDRALQELLCEGLTRQLGRACPQFLEPRHRTPRARIRVGFASAYLFDCTVGRYFASWITGLDPAKFEAIAFHTGTVRDEFTTTIAAGCDRLEPANLPVLEIAGRIAAAQLDVLVYPEIGMDPRTRLLSCLRLAPVQYAAWGHPETTGSPMIDAFLTCASMEPEGAEAHYTEALHRLPGLGVNYEAPAQEPAFSRADLRLDGDHRLYFCPHSLFKLHPDSDALFADILAADPGGILVVIQAQSATQEPARQFGDRMASALLSRGIAPGRQVRVLPRLSAKDFRRALAIADVVVDPLHWSGGNTALDALAAGVPVIASPGPLMRSRQAAAMLRRMDVPELIAASTAEAARIAVEVARDPVRRASLSRTLLERRDTLFGDAEPVAQLSEILARSVT